MTKLLNKIDAPFLYSEIEQYQMERWYKPDVLNSPITNGWLGKTPNYPYRTMYVEKLKVPFWKKSFKAYGVKLNGEIEVKHLWFLPKNAVSISQAKLAIEQYEYWKNTKFCKAQNECDNFSSWKNSTIDWVSVCTQCGKVL